MRTLLLAAALAGAPMAARAATIRVAITDYAFAPARVTVHPGDTVVWTNDDEVPHTVTALDGRFASGALAPGGRYRQHFTRVGAVRYHCAIHPEMQGTVVVAPPG